MLTYVMFLCLLGKMAAAAAVVPLGLLLIINAQHNTVLSNATVVSTC